LTLVIVSIAGVTVQKGCFREAGNPDRDPSVFIPAVDGFDNG